MLTCAGNLFQKGVSINLSAVVNGKGQVLVDLAPYPWKREGHFWNESRLSKDFRHRRFGKHDLLGSRIVETSSYQPSWRNVLVLDEVPWVRGHVVADEIVFPAAGYIAMAGEATRQLTGSTEFTIRDLNIGNALVLHDNVPTEIMTHFKARRLTTSVDSDWYDFEICSARADHPGSWIRHAFGAVRTSALHLISSHKENFAMGERHVDVNHWYRVLKGVGLNYENRFKGLSSITAGTREEKATAIINNQILRGDSTYAWHPTAMDCILQLFSVAATRGLSRNFLQLVMPTYIEEVNVCTPQDVALAHTNARITAPGGIKGDAVVLVGDQVVLRFKNVEMTPLSSGKEAEGSDLHAAAELVWRPDIQFFESSRMMRTSTNLSMLLGKMEMMMLTVLTLSSMDFKNKTPKSRHMAKYMGWIQKASVVQAGNLAKLSATERKHAVENSFHELQHTVVWAPTTAIYRLYKDMDNILLGKTQAIDLLTQDNVLARIYDTVALTDASEFFSLLAHAKPTLKILEIGAGTGATSAAILECLESQEPYYVRNYSSYTFTDISAAFLSKAKERLIKYSSVEYKVLDISRDPVEQGFESGCYDLIVASNVSVSVISPLSTLADRLRSFMPPQA